MESGGLDLEARSQGEAWRPFAAAGIPRDGGMADLLTEAKAPLPRFAAVICEDIERSARDTFNALKLEKALSDEGIPLFATDEPASIEGINATTVLVRRVKQGVAEWFRLQLREKAWKGLQEHSLDGWNIGPAPYGYAAERIPHPAPAKAAQGRTKSRLIPDPGRAPVVALIFHWRVDLRLSIPAITARLNADPAAYPTPDGKPGWTKRGVTSILANPKYTGHMVYGRTRKAPGQKKERPVPPGQWIWTPEPVHPAIIDRDMWDQAQHIGAERGNVRDPGTPTRYGHRYILRSRIRCRICQRRMCGIWITRLPRRHHHLLPLPPRRRQPPPPRRPPRPPPRDRPRRRPHDRPSRFFDQYVFGHDRAALLAAQIPASAADQQERQARLETHLRAEIARIDTAERALITELEAPADPADPAAQAYRARIRERYAELYNRRTGIDAQLAALHAAAAPASHDPRLLDDLPIAAAVLPSAPDRIKAALINAFDIQAL